MKLTLQLDKDIIKKAKQYVQEKNQGLSSLVQNYFNFFSENEKIDKIRISKNIQDMSGIIKLDEHIDIKAEYRKHIMEKYS